MSHAQVRLKFYPYIPTLDSTVQAEAVYYRYNEYNEQFYRVTDPPAVGQPIPDNVTYFEKLDSDVGWDYQLINQIVIPKIVTSPYYISIDYQAYHRPFASVKGDGEGPMYSPGLMRSVIERVDELSIGRYDNVVAKSDGAIHCLAMDLTGHNPDNFIQHEKHLVNTSDNKFVIRPICGSFYRFNGADLQLVYAANDTSAAVVLQPETGDGSGDYEVIGLNHTKTAMSEPTGGVYEFIILKKAFVGNVYVDYHAFGGEITTADINNLATLINSLQANLQNDRILTANNIVKSTVVANMLDRIAFLEHQMEHYRTQYFLYDTATMDKWVDVAYIKSHPWVDSAPTPDHEVGKLQIQVEQFKTVSLPATKKRASLDLEFKFSYEGLRDANGLITGMVIKTKEVHMSHPTVDDSGLDYFTKRLTPKFRVVVTQVDNANTIDKVMLQMAVTTIEPTQCMVVVSDKTAAKSPWILVDSLGEARPTITNPTGMVSNVIPVYGNGYSIYWGLVSMREFAPEYEPDSHLYGSEEIRRGSNLELIINGTDLQLDAITAFRAIIYDRQTDQYLTAKTDALKLNNGESQVLTGTLLYYFDDLCAMVVDLTKTSTNICSCRIVGLSGTNSLTTDRFYLTRFDVI